MTAPYDAVMDNGTDPTQPADAAIELVAHDPGWAAQFEAERALLEHALAPWLAGRIEHIGSTAVPGLPAKPVLDQMAPVHSLTAARPAIAAAATLGYLYYPYKPEVMHWFCKPSPALRTHHLHMVPAGSTVWHQRIRFRDALRASPALAAEYAALKAQLAARFRNDRDAYTEGKTAFVLGVLGETALPNTDFAIRQATADDVAALVALAQNAFRDTYRGIDDAQAIEDYVSAELTAPYFRSHTDNRDSRLLVVERGRELIGYALVARSPAPPCVGAAPSVELVRLYLRRDVQGKGIGAALMHAVHAAARGFGAAAIWLGVYDRNLRARDFYGRWGFVDVGTKDFSFGGQLYADPVMRCNIATEAAATRNA